MNAIQQRCRPKHQVLVLKCYPRTTKGAVDVKPNSSELSYLLFYAQSRRSKIQKVGSFLEKKTASDVYRLRIGNVQVTLQVLTALMEKAGKDFPLLASCVLKVLELILKSNDITMVESSIPTFEAFCENHDPTSLLGDQAYLRQYLAVADQYASLASTRSSPGKVQPSKPIALRWRNAGLAAIRSIASSDALSSATNRQYDAAVPMILENLWTDNEDFLDVLLQRAEGDEKGDPAPMKRRMSIATVRTADTFEGNPNPIALSGTAVDVDKLEEEDIGVLAMQCLTQIFSAPNRSQVHAATVALLKFTEERVNQLENVVKTSTSGKDSGWAIKMILLVARWAPVADRFTILVTAMGTLSQCPLTDENLRHHIVLAAMIGALLRSDVNLIGLSVMDILLQLIAHIRRLVQMPGDPNSMRSDPPLPGQPDPRSPTTVQFAENADRIAAQRKDLLLRLQECIGDLATHVYYADQISDMISTILLKLKPSRSSSTSSSSPQGEKAETVAASSVDDQQIDSLFALTVAKIAALRAIKSVLLVANPRTKMSGNYALSRNHVPIQVWEGTQWLFRDPDGLVRKAYADAVATWLDRETTKADAQARDETARTTLRNRDLVGGTLARRVVSSASARGDKPIKAPRSHFLQLLHVAIYDNAVQFVEYETDVVLLHVLLAKLVNRLGVNAVRYGLPMIFRLQEDIQDADTPIAKVRLGSLVHGYFWILTEKFDFEASVVGRAIHNEIVRRRSKHFWVEGIYMPPPLMELVGTPGMARPQPRLPIKEIESEALLPFDDRLALVESVCQGYEEATISPPTSPAASPGRSFSHPVIGSSLSTIPAIEMEREIPSHFREQMLADWSRDATLAAVQAVSKSTSLNGSRSGTTGTNKNRLAANGGLTANGNGHAHATRTPSPFASKANLRPSSSPAGNPGAPPAAKLRKSSVRSNALPAGRSPAGKEQAVTSVEQLKLVLSGHLQPPPTMHGLQHTDSSSSSDSLVSYDMTPSEVSFNPAAVGEPVATDGLEASQQLRPASRDRKLPILGGPLSSHPTHDSSADQGSSGDDGPVKVVPPVPPIPSGLEGRVSKTKTLQDYPATLPRPATSKRSLKSRSGDRGVSSSWGTSSEEHPVPAMDLQSLLKGIDSQAGERSLGTVTKPPY
ncbi:hypothetical protein B0T24DRAFT_428356 [Lasiosphaeria ovina]|uniref:Protein EFR3 n=1 Tax=Lasiosphaeria ovina TaxID=92902 RepID=A0AAE0JVU3_9PEZI|nr:hypothetical protein B0T24DRAFT_428356 [Lasiosphaeria ovina]